MADVLLAFATKQGFTGEVADAVASVLREAGLDVELRPAGEVRDVAGHRAVVLGAPLYMGRWHRDARRLLRRNRKALAELPVAVFALGPLSDEESQRRGAERQLRRALARAAGLEPAAVAVFAGALDPARLRFPFNRMPAGDWRDWDAIRGWAGELPLLLGLRSADERASETLLGAL